MEEFCSYGLRKFFRFWELGVARMVEMTGGRRRTQRGKRDVRQGGHGQEGKGEKGNQ